MLLNMRSHRTGAKSLAVLVALAFSWGALASSAFASDITGEVTTAQGSPEAGVQITCTDASGKTVGQATTNAAAQTALPDLPQAHTLAARIPQADCRAAPHPSRCLTRV